MRLFRTFIVIAAIVSGSACHRPAIVDTAASARRPEITTPQTGTTRYAIDADRSRIDILVYRGGPMARLGHNHVVTARSLQGDAWIHPDVERSSMSVQFPVADLIVDDEEARKAAGDDFPPDVPEKDRLGTRANMLKPEVLDGERYPLVQMRSVGVSGQLPELTITLAMTLKDVTREIEVPTRVLVNNESVQATGELVLKQTEFGIKPFSVAMGAVQVQDELTVRFDLHGRRLTSP